MFSRNSSLKCIFQFKNVSGTCNLERCKINSGISILEYNTYVLVKQSINSHPICISDFLIWYNYQIEKKNHELTRNFTNKGGEASMTSHASCSCWRDSESRRERGAKAPHVKEA